MSLLALGGLREGPEAGRIGWRKAVRADLSALATFLASREERCTGFSGRLLRSGELLLPSALRGGVYIAAADDSDQDGADLVGAVLCHPSRLAMPLLPAQGDVPAQGDEALGGLLSLRGWVPASALGSPSDLDRFCSLCGIEVKVSVSYRLMRRAYRATAAGAGSRSSSFAGGDGRAGTVPGGAAAGGARNGGDGPRIAIRLAESGDLEALLPLQIAYEHEEVLTPVHRFDLAACRAALARSLREQLVFVAEESGTIVAKAGTNARGLGYDQIGGIYTLPERRGRGIGASLVGVLVEAIAAAGRGVSLFVKPGNAAALSLYRGLGFEDIGPYRADYFDA